jgi:hypothetical protein
MFRSSLSLSLSLWSGLLTGLLALAAAAEPVPAVSFVVAAGKQTLLGWHDSGVAYVLVDGKDVQVCRDDGTDLPTAWPPGVAVGPGVLCAALTDANAGSPALAFAKQEVLTTKPVKASPVAITAAVDGDKLVLKDGARTKVLGVLAGPHKIVESLWRADAKAVAIALEPVPNPAGVRLMTMAYAPELLVGGNAGKKLAQAKEKAAQVLQKRDWSAAGTLLDEAIVADPEAWTVRYLRAAAEAQSGIGRTAMIDNLTVLKDKASTTPQAKQVIERAKNDRAFDAWAGDPEVRALIGLPLLTTMDAPTRLLERSAMWTVQGATCKTPWITMTFGKGASGGAVTVDVVDSCKGKRTKQRSTGTWKKAETGVTLSFKPLKSGAPALPAETTVALDETVQQLKLKPATTDMAVTFEPGAALLDDAVL